jgi:hypothetical protein
MGNLNLELFIATRISCYFFSSIGENRIFSISETKNQKRIALPKELVHPVTRGFIYLNTQYYYIVNYLTLNNFKKKL